MWFFKTVYHIQMIQSRSSPAALAIIDSDVLDMDILSANLSEAVEVFQIKKIFKCPLFDKSLTKAGWIRPGW